MARAEEYIAELSAVDPGKVEEALRGLVSLGEEVLRPLASRLEAEGDSTARINIMRAIGRVAYENDYFDPAVVRLLQEQRREKGIGEGSDQKALHERATYVKVLGMVGEPGCFEELLVDFKHSDGRVRANALEGVAFIIKRWTVTGGSSLLQAVEELTKDETLRVSVTASVALYLIHSIAADNLKSKIRDLSHSTDPATKAAARRAAASFNVRTESFLDLFARDSIFTLVGPDHHTGG